MAKAGRPTKISPEVQEKLTNAIRLGCPQVIACKYAGISVDSFSRWMKLGETDTKGPHQELYSAVKEAEGASVVQWLARIEQAAKEGQWQAAAWKLERRFSEHFGRKDRVTIDVNKLDSDIERELAIVATGSQGKASGEAEGETVH